jgi:hypothetical protein
MEPESDYGILPQNSNSAHRINCLPKGQTSASGGDNHDGGDDSSRHGIATTLTEHARRQAQRRGITLRTLELVLILGTSRKLRAKARAAWISSKSRRHLIRAGFAPAEIDRCAGVRLIIVDDAVVTVEHTLKRRHWA